MSNRKFTEPSIVRYENTAGLSRKSKRGFVIFSQTNIFRVNDKPRSRNNSTTSPATHSSAKNSVMTILLR